MNALDNKQFINNLESILNHIYEYNNINDLSHITHQIFDTFQESVSINIVIN